jgi:polyisoprenoid-binding protein YceI
MNKLIAAAILSLCAVSGQSATYEIDKGHSNVGFKIRHFAGRVPGRFTEFSGTIVFDEKDPSKSSVNAAIDAASINTDNGMRDKHLKTKDYFDVEKYPTITYKSTKVKAAGKGKYKVEGLLSLHGVEKPVTLDVEFLGLGSGPKGGSFAGFSAETKISRKDFGVGGMGLGDEVAISLDIEAGEAAAK